MSDNVWYLGSFPFRIVTGSPDPAGGFSCNMPYEDAKYCWWRVKNWSVSTDVSSTTSGTTISLNSGTMVNQSIILFSTELDLARRRDTTRFYNQTSGAGPIGFSYGGGIINNSGSYYPFFTLSGTAGNIQISQDPAGAASSFTGTLKGSSVTLYVIDNGADSYTATHLDITPVEWWPYASRADGSPIWSSTTGAQLQDPTN